MCPDWFRAVSVPQLSDHSHVARVGDSHQIGLRHNFFLVIFFTLWLIESTALLGTLTTVSESMSEVAQLCPTLCDPMDCSPPGFSIHGIFQARILEWVAISFSRGSSRPRNRTWVSCIAGRCFTLWATREAPNTQESNYQTKFNCF